MSKKTKQTTKQVTTNYTDEQMERRMFALKISSQLVSNPVHALACNPQNIIALSNMFYAWIEGKELEVPAISKAEKPAEDTAQAMTYA